MTSVKRVLVGKLIFFIFCSLWVVLPAQALTMKNLYEVKVPVRNQGRTERKASIRQAFNILLVRLTGNEGIGAMEQVIALGDKADQYVRQFRYEQEPVPLLDSYKQLKAERAAQVVESEGSMLAFVVEPELDRDPDAVRQVLAVKFDEKAINELIWSNQLPFWGKGRPAAVVWLAIQDSKGRFLLNTTEDNVYLEILRTQARERGIPLVFPLQDLQDQIAINVNDVWGNFESTIRSASRRYETEAILAGRLTRDITGQWHSRWSMLRPKERVDYELRHDELEVAVSEGVRQLANDLATRFAHVTVGKEKDEFFTLHIADVQGIKAYDRAIRHVKSLSSVASSQVAQVNSDKIVLKLSLRGNQQAFEQAIKLGGKLVPDQANASLSQEMFYRLQP